VPLTTFGSPPYGVRFAPCFAPLRALQAAHAKTWILRLKHVVLRICATGDVVEDRFIASLPAFMATLVHSPIRLHTRGFYRLGTHKGCPYRRSYVPTQAFMHPPNPANPANPTNPDSDNNLAIKAGRDAIYRVSW
jgi:hypothetical protein